MDLVFRCLVLFPLVVVLVRVVNRRQLHSLEPFDIVLLVVLGDLLQQGVTQNDFSVTGSAIVIIMMTLLSMLTAYVAYKSPRFSTVIDGEPVILVEHGRPLHGNLRRERITHAGARRPGPDEQHRRPGRRPLRRSRDERRDQLPDRDVLRLSRLCARAHG